MEQGGKMAKGDCIVLYVSCCMYSVCIVALVATGLATYCSPFRLITNYAVPREMHLSIIIYIYIESKK